MRKTGDKIVFTFTDSFTADSVNDARQTIEEIAREVYESPVRIEVASTAAAATAAPANPMREDPVLKAFQKHLGAEVAEGRRSK